MKIKKILIGTLILSSLVGCNVNRNHETKYCEENICNTTTYNLEKLGSTFKGYVKNSFKDEVKVEYEIEPNFLTIYIYGESLDQQAINEPQLLRELGYEISQSIISKADENEIDGGIVIIITTSNKDDILYIYSRDYGQLSN